MSESQRFPYLTVGNTTLPRPFVPIRLIFQNRAHDAFGLLDTGADVNVMPYAIGAALGAVWDAQTTQVSLTGNLAQFDAKALIVSAAVGRYDPVRLAFAWTQSNRIPLILGQVNFFIEFDICFYRAQLTVDLHRKA
ncbi:MAG: hypothetical protein CUN53_04145 [Phototrophicales bacterium]|nr:MAG: hypothetical protein CUN53_04145 [Phototrophicales bacterium]